MGGELDRVGGKFLEKLEKRKYRATRALGHFSRLTGGVAPEILLLNEILTKWLIHCDFNHLHQSLGYLSPIESLNRYHKVLPMSPSSTAA